MKKLLILILILAGFVPVHAQVDRDFWFVAPFINSNHGGDQPKNSYFCVAAMDLPVDIIIEMPANASFTPINITLPAGGFQRIPLHNIYYNSTAASYTYNSFFNFQVAPVNKFQTVNNYGLHIYSTNNADFTIYYHFDAALNRDLFSLKGKNALGTEFYVPMQIVGFNGTYSDQARSQIDIVATEDDTWLTIYPTADLQSTITTTAASYTPNFAAPIVVNLPFKGCTYSIRARGKNGNQHLSGTIIRATKKIAVTNTDDSANPNYSSCYDIVGDQMVPKNICGKKYVVMKSMLNQQDRVYICATEPNTDVYVDDDTLKGTISPYSAATPALPSIPQNTTLVLQIPTGKTFMYIRATKPICVLHVGGFGCEIGGAILPPIENCTGSLEVSFYRMNRSGEQFFINLMCRDGAENGFRLITSCGDTVPIPSNYFEQVPFSGIFGSPTEKVNRGWWVIKDQYKRFGCAAGSCATFTAPCNNDGDVAGGVKNGIPVRVDDVSKIINVKDFFHLGWYGGGPSSTNQYGYFSSFNKNMGGAQEVGTGTPEARVCYKDTVTLYANGGLHYEWFFDPSKLGDTTKFTKEFLTVGKDKKSVCPASGFTISPPDTLKVFDFRVKIGRSICFGDTIAPLRVLMLAPILVNVGFNKTQICSGDTFKITNATTGADKSYYDWKYWDSYTNGWYSFNPTPVYAPSFSKVFTVPYDSVKNRFIKVQLTAQNEHCAKVLTQDLIVHPNVKADFTAVPLNGCNPLGVSFTQNSLGASINSRSWDFGDGASAFDLNPTHVFMNPNLDKDMFYTTKLTVKNAYCTSVKSTVISVTRQIQASFALNKASICTPDTVVHIKNNAKISSSGVNPPGYVQVQWNFLYGDGRKTSSTNSSTEFDWKLFGNYGTTPRVDTIIQKAIYCYDGVNKCVDSIVKTITVYPIVYANFTTSVIAGCSPLNVTFTKPNNKVPVSMFWDFGDGNTSIDTSNTITHTFQNITSTDAVYKTKLVVQSQNLCRIQDSISITVAEEVKAFFSVDTSQGCAPLRVKITNASREYRDMCVFQFGDGTPAATNVAKNAVFYHNFDNNSAVPVVDSLKLEVTNNNSGAPFNGCASRMVIPIRLFPKVEALIDTNRIMGCQPYLVTFTNMTSTNIANKFSWNFGDGTSSAAKDTIHTFTNLTASDVTRNVSMIAYTPYGCTDTAKRKVTVGAYIKADYKINLNEGCSPLTVHLYNKSSQVTAIPSYFWDYGDGTRITKTDTLNFSKTYTNKTTTTQVNNLKLRVYHTVHYGNDSLVCRDSMIKTITVFPEVHPSFTVDKTEGCQPLNVRFTNYTPASFDASATKYDWTFGDGTGFTKRDTSHTYVNSTPNDVVYTVKLHAETDKKCYGDSSMNITAYGKFKADFTVQNSNVCSGYPVTLVNSSTGSQISTYGWDFDGDGNVDQPYLAASQPASFTHIFSDNNMVNPRVYTVKLYVVSTHNCSDTITGTATVYPKVSAKFEVRKVINGLETADSAECSPFESKMVYTGNTKVFIYHDWYFWDMTTSADPSPSRIFTNPYDYDITVPIKHIVTSEYQCKDSVTHNMIIYHKPVVKFEANPTIACSPMNVQFTNNTISTDSRYHWTFGDNATQDTETKENVTHTYVSTYVSQRQYNVTLTAETKTGLCVDSSKIKVFANPTVVASFLVDSTGCAPYNVQFTDQSQNAYSYDWDFDDSVKSVSVNPLHQFSEEGIYNVKLTIRSIEGCTAKVARNVFVYPVPRADFTALPMLQLYPSATVTLNNISKTATGIWNWSYKWDMDDGTIMVDKDPSPYRYSWWADSADQYKYNITLYVYNEFCADTMTHDVVIKPAIPVALFDTLLSSCPPAEIHFSNHSKYARSYLWKFGDNTTSTLAEPLHVFDTAGIYTVILVATGEGGEDSYYRNIRIFDAPVANFKVEPLDPMLPNAVIKCMNLSKYATSYLWDFNDGITVTEKDPIHQYYRLGQYWITLSAKSDSGCVDTMKYPKPVIVDGPGKIVFPNAFTPNLGGPSGGKYNASKMDNDVFYPWYDGVVEYKLEIYNRWGELIFTSDNVETGWDGYFKGSICKQDVYVYKCKGSFLNGKTFNVSGDVTLLYKE